MSWPNTAGGLASTVPPSSASRAAILGPASAALISPLSLSTMAEGVRPDAPPVAGLVARHEIAHGRQLGQGLRPFRGGHRQRPHLAALDVLERRGHGREQHLHLSG